MDADLWNCGITDINNTLKSAKNFSEGTEPHAIRRLLTARVIAPNFSSNHRIESSHPPPNRSSKADSSTVGARATLVRQLRDRAIHYLQEHQFSILAKISLSEYNKYSSSPIFTGAPPKLGNKTLSPAWTDTGINLPLLGSCTPGPAETTVPSFNFSWFFSGM